MLKAGSISMHEKCFRNRNRNSTLDAKPAYWRAWLVLPGEQLLLGLRISDDTLSCSIINVITHAYGLGPLSKCKSSYIVSGCLTLTALYRSTFVSTKRLWEMSKYLFRDMQSKYSKRTIIKISRGSMCARRWEAEFNVSPTLLCISSFGVHARTFRTLIALLFIRRFPSAFPRLQDFEIKYVSRRVLDKCGVGTSKVVGKWGSDSPKPRVDKNADSVG